MTISDAGHSTEARLDAELEAAGASAAEFRETDLRSPLEVTARILETPAECTARGMFFEQVSRAARELGLPSDTRYVPFRNYPLRQYMELVVQYGRARYPEVPLRQALRRVGWEAFPALMGSVAGRVIFAFAGRGVQGALRLAPEAYKHSMSHAQVTTRICGASQAVLELRNVWNFPECYQIGVIEGACRSFGAEVRVRVRVRSSSSVDLLVRW